MSGAYIETAPGDGPNAKDFVALEEPPSVASERGGVVFSLAAVERGAIRPNAPIFYRGVEVGLVADYLLSSDSRRVIFRFFIDKPFRQLVRVGSRFWRVGGVQMRFSWLHGAQMAPESLSAFLKGGVEFATPDPPGRLAKEGQTFELEEKSQDEWLKWSPALEVPRAAVSAPEGVRTDEESTRAEDLKASME
jgi:paraquat-inducible protein B